MTHVEILDAARDRAGGYKVDVSRGERIGRVSSEWFSRPADERYLSLSDLYAAVHGRTERSRTRTVESAASAAGRGDRQRNAGGGDRAWPSALDPRRADLGRWTCRRRLGGETRPAIRRRGTPPSALPPAPRRVRFRC